MSDMHDADIRQLQSHMQNKEWDSVYAMLNAARDQANTQDDVKRETYWRFVALEREQRYRDAVEFMRDHAHLFDSQTLVHLQLAGIFLKLGHEQEALDELSRAPIEEEMENYYGLAIDAKFLYFYLLAKGGDSTIISRLAEIPDDYRHITMEGKFLTKSDIVSFIK